MARVFLSYSRKDAAKADRFTKWLETKGHSVWRDEDDIGGGASFSSEIEKALKDSDAVLVLWSTNSIQSAWVRDEAAYARDRGKLIPFSLDAVEPPLGFRQFQSIDLSRWTGRGAPPHEKNIGESIARIARPKADSAPLVRNEGRPTSVTRLRRVLFLFLLAGLAAAGFLIWGRRPSEDRITIAVAAAPNSPDRATAIDYANVTVADLAAFLPVHTDKVQVVSPNDPRSDRSDYRMEVSSSQQGKSIAATVSLSDVSTGDVIWSKSWSVADATPAELRQPISLAVSHAMLCLLDAIVGTERLRQPALGIYMSGCVGFDDQTHSGADTKASFERVIGLAPNFAPGWAYAALMRADDSRNSQGMLDPVKAKKAREAAAMARKLDPSSAKPLLAEAFLSNDNLRILALLEKGAALDPSDTLIQATLSNVLLTVGRLTDSIDAGQRAVELDPYSPYAVITYIVTLRATGKVQEMQAQIDRARRMWAGAKTADTQAFVYALQYGDPQRAAVLLQSLDFDAADQEAYRKVISARLNPTRDTIDAALSFYLERARKTPALKGQYLLMLGIFGRTDEAFAFLSDKASRNDLNAGILFGPALARVRDDPRFMKVVADLGLVRYWRLSGHWPDFCSDPRLSYDCKVEAAKYP